MIIIFLMIESNTRRKQYSDNEKATTLAALKANGGNAAKTARDTGIPLSTLRRWVQDPHPDVVTLHHVKKESLHKILESLAYKLTGAMDDDTISKMSGQQKMTSAAIAIDKMRLLREQPADMCEPIQSPSFCERVASA